MLSNIRIAPKFDVNEDIDALLARQKQKSNSVAAKEINAKQQSAERNSNFTMDIDNRWARGKVGSSHGTKFTSEPSRVAQMLEFGDEHSWTDAVRTSFQSQTHEKLFRSMKVVVPERQAGASQRRPSSAMNMRDFRSDIDSSKSVISSQHCRVWWHFTRF